MEQNLFNLRREEFNIAGSRGEPINKAHIVIGGPVHPRRYYADRSIKQALTFPGFFNGKIRTDNPFGRITWMHVWAVCVNDEDAIWVHWSSCHSSFR